TVGEEEQIHREVHDRRRDDVDRDPLLPVPTVASPVLRHATPPSSPGRRFVPRGTTNEIASRIEIRTSHALVIRRGRRCCVAPAAAASGGTVPCAPAEPPARDRRYGVSRSPSERWSYP